jgi:hypothetical protein
MNESQPHSNNDHKEDTTIIQKQNAQPNLSSEPSQMHGVHAKQCSQHKRSTHGSGT